ncbi:response regulator [Loktanella agnita]|uniref:response regulator n=1 Tax=Loktanella agnita TaxID=287097 RepID=UPI00398752BE
MDSLNELMMSRAPTAHRPLLGLTLLVVEDSRFACEAMRLLCMRSGARIRRADSLEHARRHLSVYRPSVILVDVGLPDGSGLDLIGTLTGLSPRIEVILGISGDTAVEPDVMAAGADGFIAKPIQNLSAFQSAILRHLPAERQPAGPRPVTEEDISPDPIAYQDDLAHISQVLENSVSGDEIDYVTQFLGGVARSAHDHDLDQAVTRLANRRTTGASIKPEMAALSEMVQMRIAAGGLL